MGGSVAKLRTELGREELREEATRRAREHADIASERYRQTKEQVAQTPQAQSAAQRIVELQERARVLHQRSCELVDEQTAKLESKLQSVTEAGLRRLGVDMDSLEVASDSGSEASVAGDAHPPRQVLGRSGAWGTQDEPSLPFSLENLQDVLAVVHNADAHQLAALGHWWHMLGLHDTPKLRLLLQLEGDGSALEIAVEAPRARALDVVPELLEAFPEVSEPPSQGIAPPLAAETTPEESGRPPRQKQFLPEALLRALPPDAPPETFGTTRGKSKNKISMQQGSPVLPSTLADARPRAKAKAKVKASPSSALLDAKALPHSREESASSFLEQQLSRETSVSSFLSQQAYPVPSPPQEVRVPIGSSAAVGSQREFHQPDGVRGGLSSAVSGPLYNAGDSPQSSPPRQQTLSPVQGREAQPQQPRPPPSDIFQAARRAAAAAASAPGVSAGASTESPRPKQPGPRDPRLPGMWQETLRRMAHALAAPRAMLWLRLSDLGKPAPRASGRTVDAGVRFFAAEAGAIEQSFSASRAEVAAALADAGLTEEQGWELCEEGCSLFAHGPAALFGFRQIHKPADRKLEHRSALEPRLLRKLAPPGLEGAVRDLKARKQVHTAVRASLRRDDTVDFTLRCELPDRAGDESQMIVDFAVGATKVYDALMVERTRQALAGIGALTSIVAMECRAKGSALITLRLQTATAQRRGVQRKSRSPESMISSYRI